MEKFNKPSASSQEYMSSSSEDETKGGETWIFLNALYVDSKACEDWIRCYGYKNGLMKHVLKQKKGATHFSATFVLLYP